MTSDTLPAQSQERTIETSVFVLRLNRASLASYRLNLRLRSECSAQLALARAIGSSPSWASVPRATLVVRAGEEPVLGVLASLSQPMQGHRIEAQVRAAESAVGRLRYIGYQQAERCVERLAAELVRRFGHEEICQFRYAAIPRGGLIVLGMLAEVLRIPHSQLEGSADPHTPLVVVDDCALSGARFSAFLASRPMDKVIFAHLFSHPTLRAAIEEREARVVTCVSSFDLVDHGPELGAEEYAVARRRWIDRLGSSRYWIGDPDRVCFPWTEPDHLLWNPVDAEVESGWKLLPPERCLNGRQVIPTPRPRIEVQPAGKGTLRPSQQALFGRLGKETLMIRLDTGERFRLNGSGQDMWWALVKQDSTESAVKALLRKYHVAESILRSDLAAFTATALERGLLAES